MILLNWLKREMFTYFSEHTNKLTGVALVLVLLGFPIGTSFGHSPHDVIARLALSPSYEKDKTVYIYVSSDLFKSTNGGYSWKQLVKGLQKGYSASSIVISPSYGLDNTVYSSSYDGGIYRSSDAGLSWNLLQNELEHRGIELLSISPAFTDDRLLLAVDQGGALHRTTNGGDSFQEVYRGEKITAIAFSRELKNRFICIGDAKGALYVSIDNGKIWHPKAKIPNSEGITSISVSPNFSSDETIFIGTEGGGLFQSLDGGNSFKAITGVSDKSITSVVISHNFKNDSEIFVSTWQGVYRSSDGGDTWKKSSKGLTTSRQANTSRFKAPHFLDLQLSQNFNNRGTLFVGGFDGLFKSEDGGESWIELETLVAGHPKWLAFSPDYKDDSMIGVTTFFGGFYLSKDRGNTWKAHNKGLFSTHLNGIGFSPNISSDHTIFTSDNRRLYKTVDLAQNWQPIERCEGWGWKWRKRISSLIARIGLPSGILQTQSDELCDRLFFPRMIKVSPGFETDRTLFFGTRYEGIFRSVDAGITWTPVSIEGKMLSVTSLALSPNFPSDPIIFAGVKKEGIYVSKDGGISWKMVFSTKSHERVFVEISPNFVLDKTAFASTGEGLLRTKDGGITWEKVGGNCCDDKVIIKAIAVSPSYQKDKMVIVSIQGIGLYKSENGGDNFVEIGTELINENYNLDSLEFSPAYEEDRTIVGASYEEIFLSTDSGQTWDMVERPIRYEEFVSYIRYEGNWVSMPNSDFSSMKAIYSVVPTSRAKFTFVGTGISLIGSKGNDHGVANVYLDGKFRQTVNQFSSEQEFMAPVFSVDNLSKGPHSIEVEVTNSKDSQSSGYQIVIDAFDVIR